MGLDMYAFSTPDKLSKSVDFDFTPSSKEFFYWRKHPNLHGWMEKLYYKKGGKDEEFAGPVELKVEDLIELENDIINSNLPETIGFFFGVSKKTFDEDQNDLKFIKEAKELILKGNNIFYTSSW